MRRAVIIMLIAALAGCTTIRKTLGTNKTADKGVTASDSDPAPVGKKGKKAKPLDLPGGLGGDKEHRAYTGDVPR